MRPYTRAEKIAYFQRARERYTKDLHVKDFKEIKDVIRGSIAWTNKEAAKVVAHG